MWLVDLNYNFGRDWLIEHNNFASKLKEKCEFFKPTAIEEIVIFMMKTDILRINA